LSILLEEDGGQGGIPSQPQKLDFRVTFFDMPVLENIRLPNGDRLTVTLSSYFSPPEYGEFVEHFPDKAAIEDYQSPAYRNCKEARLTLLKFPDSYIGPRDRPYIQNLIKTKL
jgi:hypothetical protein